MLVNIFTHTNFKTFRIKVKIQKSKEHTVTRPGPKVQTHHYLFLVTGTATKQFEGPRKTVDL